jgi:hypothetical protein
VEDEEGSVDQANKDGCSVLHIDIPYFGILRISRDGTEAQLAGQVEPVYGMSGVPELVDDRKMPPAVTTRSLFSGASEPAQLIGPHSSTSNPSLIDFSLHMDESGLDALQQLTYPDLTATVDEWAFQGVDTAFFGNLMGNNGFAIGEREESNSNSWAEANYPPKATEDFFKT